MQIRRRLKHVLWDSPDSFSVILDPSSTVTVFLQLVNYDKDFGECSVSKFSQVSPDVAGIAPWLPANK